MPDTLVATSTTETLTTAWAFVGIFVIIILGLIGTAAKLLRNQNN
jgi:hypothetical protein